MRGYRAIEDSRRPSRGRGRLAEPVHAAAIGTEQTGCAHEESALAGSRTSRHHHDLAAPHVQRDAAERLNRRSAAAEADAISFVNAEEAKYVGHGAGEVAPRCSARVKPRHQRRAPRRELARLRLRWNRSIASTTGAGSKRTGSVVGSPVSRSIALMAAFALRSERS